MLLKNQSTLRPNGMANAQIHNNNTSNNTNNDNENIITPESHTIPHGESSAYVGEASSNNNNSSARRVASTETTVPVNSNGTNIPVNSQEQNPSSISSGNDAATSQMAGGVSASESVRAEKKVTVSRVLTTTMVRKKTEECQYVKT